MTDPDALRAACAHAWHATRPTLLSDVDPVVHVITTMGPSDEPAGIRLEPVWLRERAWHGADDLLRKMRDQWARHAEAEARRWHRAADHRILFGHEPGPGCCP